MFFMMYVLRHHVWLQRVVILIPETVGHPL
jgi:hypothetical protein